MANSKIVEFLRRPICSPRVDLIIEITVAFIAFILFLVGGIFMALWGNLSGGLWPIPKNPAPLWIRLPVGIVLISISGLIFNEAKKTIKKMSKKQQKI
jgi:hypothetical protein